MLSCLLVRKRDVESLLESPPDGSIKPPGTAVAPSTTMPSLSTPICTRNSALMCLVVSFSKSDCELQRESTSSMKMTAGLLALASSNRFFVSFPLSPTHLVTRSEEEMEKNVDSASVATAFAR